MSTIQVNIPPNYVTTPYYWAFSVGLLPIADKWSPRRGRVFNRSEKVLPKIKVADCFFRDSRLPAVAVFLFV